MSLSLFLSAFLTFLCSPTSAQLVDSILQWPNFSIPVKASEIGLQRKAKERQRNNNKTTDMIFLNTFCQKGSRLKMNLVEKLSHSLS